MSMTTTTKTNEIAILVTGATGTVGSEVVKQLTSPSSSLSSGSQVRAAVHSKDKADKLRSENKEVEIFHMDYKKKLLKNLEYHTLSCAQVHLCRIL